MFNPATKTELRRIVKRLAISLAVSVLVAADGFSQQADPEAMSLGIKMFNAADAYDILKFKGMKLPRRDGVVVITVFPNSPADKAGIVAPSLIRKFNDKPVRDVGELIAELAKIKPGTEVNIFGSRPIMSQGGLTWKSGSAKITPATYRDVILSALRKSNNPTDKTVVWSHCRSPQPLAKSTYLSASIVEDAKGDVSLWMTNHYCTRNWLHVGRMVFEIGEEERFDLDSELTSQEKNRSYIWEWKRERVDRKKLKLLQAIVRSGQQDVVVRYIGKQNKHSRKLTAAEKTQLELVLEAFALMGGKIE